MIKRHQLLIAWGVALLLLASSGGIIGAHSHADGNDQNCTRCHTVQLTRPLTDLSALSRALPVVAIVGPSEAGRTFPSLPASLTYRGPPAPSSTS